jgi:hypothetical protein
VSGGFKPMAVNVDGTTVAWDHGLHFGAHGGQKGLFEGGGQTREATAFSRTFATPDEAKAFANSFDPGATDTREMDFREIGEGEAVTYSRTDGMTFDAGLMAKGTVSAGGGEQIAVTGKKDTLEMTYDVARDAGLGGGLHNGVLGTDGKRSWEKDVHATIEVDRTSEEAVQALQDLADGTITLEELREAAIPGVSIEHRDGVEWCDEGNMDLWAADLSEKHCEGGGTYSNTESGESGETVTGGSRDSESRWFHWAYDLLGGTGHTRAGTYEDALTAYQPKVTTFEGEGGTHLYARQDLNFEAHENSRRLRDQVDHGNDLEHFAEGLGGGREKEHWTLETVIDAEGTQAIADAFSGNTPYEWEAQKQIWGLKRQLADGSLTYEEAMAQLVDYGGEDAIEGFHDLAGEHAERFLTKEGSDVWIGRAGNRKLDEEVEIAIRDNDVEKLKSLLDRENSRMGLLKGRERETVPNQLIDEEANRSGERVDRLIEHLGFGSS